MTATAGPPRASGDAPSRLRRRTVLIAFGLVLGAILGLAAVGALLADAPAPPPDCAPGTECGGPPTGGAEASIAPAASAAAVVRPTATPTLPPAAATLPPDTVGIRAGVPWTSADHGIEFEYSDWWAVDSSDGSRVDLVFQGPADALLIVASVAASEATPEALADHWFDQVRAEAPDLRVDAGEPNAILGPAIGFVDGIGRTYAGTWTTPQAATIPIGVSLVTASDGRTTTAVVLVVWNPDEQTGSTWMQHAVRGTAELVLKTFRWGPS